MSRKAKKEAELSIQSGFRHHDMLTQQELVTLLLKKKGKLPASNSLNLDTYAQVLAPTPFRAMQNALICLTTIVSRMVIQLGVSTEKSFALSDYFVYTVEEKKNRAELEALLDDMLSSYSDLLQAESIAAYSQKVTKAIFYIQEHLYEPCPVSEVANHLGLNPRYFATLFKNEVGISPSAYIKQKKMDEACHLLIHRDLQINEIAEMLGFCNTAYFSAEFKRTFGKSPRQYILLQFQDSEQ